MRTKLSLRRMTGVAVAAALPVAMLGVTVPSVQAEEVGKLQLTPQTGNQASLLTVDTLAPCPVGSATVRVDLLGPGIQENNGGLKGLTTIEASMVNQHGGLTIQLSERFVDVFQANDVKDPSGTYTVSTLCFDESGFFGTGELNGSVAFTATSGDYNANYTQLSNGVATTTALAVAPSSAVTSGTQSTLTATVATDPASEPVGSVQFKRGAVNIGSPVPLVSGSAQISAAIPAGSHNLAAVFTPTDDNDFAPSASSALPYVVAGPASVTGTVQVGSTVTCAITAGGTQTFQWLVNGVAAAGFAARTAKIPATWYNKSLSCRTTVTGSSNSVVQTSPAKKVALGAALRVVTKPTVKGTAKVGKKLTCTRGTWSPAAAAYKYQWLRNGKAINRATKPAYRLVRIDKGKKISCKVTAMLTGYANGVTKTAAKKVS